ncbi:Lipid A export permease/ATP-binding protein MsbA [Olavius algarvensis associated proteobacterium Delta 3]|nr:Lipid A export permease/ATP-binding protein MsbA [Olavius algarvensis associated proteobacterium Delta 3]
MALFRLPKLRPRHKRIVGMVFENRFRLLIAMGCSLVISATTALSAYLIKPVIDDIFFKGDLTMLKVLPIAVVLIYVARGVGMYGQEYMMNYVGESIIMKFRNTLYARIQDLPLSFFHSETTGVLMSRITHDVSIAKGMVSSAVTGVLRDVFSVIGLTFVIFYQDWKMAIFAFLVLPAAFYPVIEFGRRVRRVSTGCQEAFADLNSFLHETFSGNKIVKAFGMEGYEKKRFAERTGSYFQLEMKAVIARSLSSPIMEFLGGVGIAFVIWYGGYKVITGASTAGTFFSFMGAVIMLYDPVKKLSGLNNAIQQGMAATDRMFDVLERESDIREDPDPVTLERKPHRVSFQQVSFKYDEAMVLRDINLDVEAGEILAIVGMSGGGKTSLVNLVPRFYDVSEGRIAIDGTDIRKASIKSLRDQIAIVTQEPILFDDTVRNNIAYGNPDATEEDIIRAAKAAYAYDFVKGFSNQFETTIGELGSRLSGGEKQRICIARALLKDAPILILDEATSSLDAESELLVQKALENLMIGRTTFVIAHRLSTISYAKRIIVLVNGRIVEEGTQDDLIHLDGAYCKLYRMQHFGNSELLSDGESVSRGGGDKNRCQS